MGQTGCHLPGGKTEAPEAAPRETAKRPHLDEPKEADAAVVPTPTEADEVR